MDNKFLSQYYKLTENKLVIDNKDVKLPQGIFPISFKNNVNICYINVLVHFLRKFGIFDKNLKSIDNEFNIQLTSQLNKIASDFIALTSSSVSQYFLHEFKESFISTAYDYLIKNLGIYHPDIGVTKKGGIMLRLLGSFIIPTLDIKTNVNYTSSKGDVRTFYYHTTTSDNTIIEEMLTPKQLLISALVSDLKQHAITCCNITPDKLFDTNFNHDIDEPYLYNNKSGLSLANSYFTLEHFNSVGNSPIIDDKYVKYFTDTYGELLTKGIFTLEGNKLLKNPEARLIEQGDSKDLDYKICIFEIAGKKIVSKRMKLMDMSYFICNKCKKTFPYIYDNFTLSNTDDYIIYNKYKGFIIKDVNISNSITFKTNKKTKQYEPIFYSCAFSNNKKLFRGHIISISKEPNGKFYLYEDERLPIECDPNIFNTPKTELIILYKLISQ